MHIERVFDWATKTEGVLNESTSSELATIVNTFTSRSALWVLNPEEFPSDLLDLIGECEAFDHYAWYEGWRSTEIAHRFGTARGRYQAENKMLLGLYNQIKSTGYRLTESELASWEEKLEIVLSP